VILTFPVALLWELKAAAKYPSTNRTPCKFRSTFGRSHISRSLAATQDVLEVVADGQRQGVPRRDAVEKKEEQEQERRREVFAIAYTLISNTGTTTMDTRPIVVVVLG